MLGLLIGITIFFGSLLIGIILFLLIIDALKEKPKDDQEKAVTTPAIRLNSK